MSSSIVPIPRTEAATRARRKQAATALARVHTVLARMCKDHGRISFAAVARHASVSRTFLYTNPDARQAVTDAISTTTSYPHHGAERPDNRQAPWRERALNAEATLKTASSEILKQRNQIGELMGQIRDLQAEWTEEANQRVTTENTTLKQRVRQLTADSRVLEERLQAARSTLRFQDRRLADLETQLLQLQTAPSQ